MPTDTTSFFLDKTASVYPVKKTGLHTFTVDVQHDKVEVVILYGSADISQAAIQTFSYKDGEVQSFTPQQELKENTKVWIFTLLLPTTTPEGKWMIDFGIGAGDQGSTAARVRMESELGDANTFPDSLGLGALPKIDFIKPNHRSPKLRKFTFRAGKNNVWVALGKGLLSEVELDAHIFLVDSKKNIVGYWGKDKGKEHRYGSNVAGDCFFVCLVNASAALQKEKNKTGFHFHVGDPQKDARVVVGEQGMD